MEIINIKDAPAAIGPYCHAMKVGNLLFCSGQTPLDPATMQLVGTTIEEQTARVLENLAIVLAGAGLTLQNIVKTTVYLKSMDDFQGMNRVYAERFAGHTPSRTTIAVKQNPLDALVEIECIAELFVSSFLGD
ncbi:MAG: reactive intermediate/imine deaminase [Desulfuromonas sp.]|nr:MAG: reactive intermediate/imine deaminase [Desulfuromonas sp.]